MGKWFYALAETHGKSKWLFAILGIVVYYVMIYVVGFGLVFYAVTFNDNTLLNMSDISFSLLCIPFGLLGAWGFYRILKSNWEKQEPISSDELLDDKF